MDMVPITNVLPNVFLGSRGQLRVIWAHTKAAFIVPLLKLAVTVGLVLSTVLFIEVVYLLVVILLVKLLGRKPEKRYKWEPLKDDLEMGNSAYPMVLVQIPMFNEKEVYQLSIAAVCDLSWPSDRILIQVLDGSTDPVIKASVETECQRWASKGVNIKYQHRDNSNGYKAGALKEGLNQPYVKKCDFVAIFDADFQPEPDFLRQTIPFLVHNPQLALVQGHIPFSRYNFHFSSPVPLRKPVVNPTSPTVNSNECLMTRLQEMSQNFHFTVEQEVGSSTYAFFSFNGAAGVWRLDAIHEAGGWEDRTTVEDMDLAIRASLRGWKFVYIDSIKVKNELPSTFESYRYQQHRWSCGPANLFKKVVMEIIRNKKVPLWKKVHVIYSFFLVRKIISHIVPFVFYVVVIPATVFVPEVQVPKWGTDYIQAYSFYVVIFLITFGTPRSLHLIFFWMLFESVMSLHRTKGIIIGLLESSRAKEWVVTKKLGHAQKIQSGGQEIERPRLRIGERLHLLELGVGAYLFFCACYGAAFGKSRYYIFLFSQAVAFFIAGFGYIGTFVPNS